MERREQIPASITKTKAGENRAKLILVFFFSLPSPTRPEISPSQSYRAGSLSTSLIRQWPPPLLPPPASCYASTLSSSASHVRAPPVSPGLFISLFFGGKSLSLFSCFRWRGSIGSWPAWCFPWAVELKKQISCSMQLSNLSNDYIAFKVRLSFADFLFPFFLLTWTLFPFLCESSHLRILDTDWCHVVGALLCCLMGLWSTFQKSVLHELETSNLTP